MPTQVSWQPDHFLNRELSWLEFNARVLEEAEDVSNPPLERAKFLAIFSSNLDEFFMVRVAGIREQVFGAMAPQDPPIDGLTAAEQLAQITDRARQLVRRQYVCWNESVAPALAEAGIRLLREEDLSDSQRKVIDEYFHQRVLPVLTPMAIDPSHPSPRFHNRGLYLAATLRRKKGIGPERLFAVVQLPTVTPRFVPVEQGGVSRLFATRGHRRRSFVRSVRRLRTSKLRDVPRDPRHGCRSSRRRGRRHAPGHRSPAASTPAERSGAA